jgi:DNA-binding IclR family transcriptional regulator
MTQNETGGVKSARRVLEVLEYLAESSSGATFPQLADGLGLPKSSLHALLATLMEQGWIYLHEPTRKYRIGLRLWQVAQSFSGLDSLAHHALKHLEAVRDEVNETVQLAVLEGIDNVYIAKVESDHPLRLVSQVGTRLPAYATGLGKVLLAYLEPAEFRRRMAKVTIERFTTRTVPTIKALEEGLADIRMRGYGEDEGEYTPGVHCVAVPIFGREGEIAAAMSCSIPMARFGGTDKERAVLLDSLSRHAKALTDELSSASIHRK